MKRLTIALILFCLSAGHVTAATTSPVAVRAEGPKVI